MVLEESSDETDQDRCSAIVEADNPLRWITEVGGDEAHFGEKFSLLPLYLGHLPPGPVPTLGLVSKVVVAYNGPSGRPFHRLLHQVLYLLPQHLIGRKPDGIAYGLFPGTRTPLAGYGRLSSPKTPPYIGQTTPAPPGKM